MTVYYLPQKYETSIYSLLLIRRRKEFINAVFVYPHLLNDNESKLKIIILYGGINRSWPFAEIRLITVSFFISGHSLSAKNSFPYQGKQQQTCCSNIHWKQQLFDSHLSGCWHQFARPSTIMVIWLKTVIKKHFVSKSKWNTIQKKKKKLLIAWIIVKRPL